VSRLQEIVEPLVDTLAIVDAEHFELAGVRHPANPRANRFFTLGALPEVVGHVAQVLYDRFYIQRDEGRGPYVAVFDRLLKGTYGEQLAEANAVPWTWQEGWTVHERPTESGPVEVLHRSGARRFVGDDELRVEGGGALIRLPSSSASAQPGFFHISGSRDHGMSETGTVRFYWNCSLAASVPIVRQLTTRLAALDVPFHFKIVDDPQLFMRADNTVLYVPTDVVADVLPAVVATYGELGRYLRSRVPLFTRELAPGLAVAEDPGNGDSFGMHRSRLVAEGLWDASRARRTTARGRLTAVVKRFVREGVDPERPHLSVRNRAVDDLFDLDLQPYTEPVLRALG
jgi:hypothetical protein